MPTSAESVPLERYASSAETRSLGSHLVGTLKYLFTTEVHTFAFAIAANALLCFIPFTLLLLALCRNVLHSQAAANATIALVREALPSNQNFITRNLEVLARSHSIQLVSLGMLLFDSTGVFLPLEVALNRIWGFPKNRGFLHNQAVSLGLAFSCGLLALLSVFLTAMHLSAIKGSFGRLGWSGTASFAGGVAITLTALPATILALFLFYYVMPNGKVPVRPVLLASVLGGVLIEMTKHVFIWALPRLKFPEVYGPFSVSVTLIMWAFVSALVVLAGAHWCAQCAGPTSHVQGPASQSPSV